MSRFVQLHALTVYPPSNPNRDDLGRPKTAEYGGAQRLRISSQALKRAIRLHPAMQERLQGALGQRTQRLGEEIKSHLIGKGQSDETAEEIAKKIAPIFGALDQKKPMRIRQLAFVSPAERKKALELAERSVDGEDLPEKKELAKDVLATADGAADIAMFGRMLADNPDFNRDAAVQVAHAITTHRAQVEDDFYTAVDDLKRPSEDMGAGFLGETGFGSGVFYTYACIDGALLIENLGGDRALATKATEAFVEAFALASPSGTKNSFANHVRAEFLLATRGDSQPLSLASAFLQPVYGPDLMHASIKALQQRRGDFATAYGAPDEAERALNIHEADGAPLAEIARFAAEGVDAAPTPERAS